jgi:hypothetical protein
MVLNAYGSAVLGSEMDFPIWARQHKMKNPVEKGHVSEAVGETKKYDELIANGYTVTVDPFTSRWGDGRETRMYTYVKREGGPEAEEKYKINQFLYQYIYIANTVGIDLANHWVESLNDGYHKEEYIRAINNKPKLAYCQLKNEKGQCKMNCPYFNCGCKITEVQELASQTIIDTYEPVKRGRKRGF